MALVKCNHCGKEISDTSDKCIYCETPFYNELKCVECGKDVSANDYVCSNCGNQLKTPRKKSKKYLFLIIGAVVISVVVLGIYIFLDSNKSKVNFEKVFDEVGCTSHYCEVDYENGSYLKIDTNPFDKDKFSDFRVMEFIKQANIEVGFSNALYQKMEGTRALDGTLSDENNNVRVTWTYHPDHGLQVIYSLK